MKLNVKRKVREINLKVNEFMLPVYEVIVNGIHAIEESKQKNGIIRITITRNKSQQTLEGEDFNQNFPMTSIQIKDNGIGFTDAAFNAFDDGYTDYKLKRGGKGVGRFTVLGAFKKMSIESRYQKNGSIYNRHFDFTVEKEIETKGKSKISDINETGTSILLDSYLPQFQERTNISLEDFCTYIVSHCLVFFLTGNMPKVLVTDEGKTHNLVDYFNEFLNDKKIVEFNVSSNKFLVYFLQKKSNIGSNQIHLCAHNRSVETIPIKKIIPNLYNPIEKKDEQYFIQVFVTGEYLDSNLNEIRNSFTFPKKEADLVNDLYADVSYEGLIDVIKNVVENEFASVISEIEDNKIATISDYVLSGDGIEYRHLLDHPEELSTISPEKLSPEKLDSELHRINYQLEKDHRKEVSKVLSKAIDNSEDYTEELKRILIDESKFSQSKLADYVIRRKVVLNIFEKFLDWEDEKYKKEEELHNIIYPMGGDSDTIPFSKHNLWLLDERLTFHTYSASDKKLKKTKTIKSDSGKEPDLSIFDKRWVYAPDEEFSTLVIFEFKRPGREISAKDIDSQVIEYFQKIMKGKTKNYRGRKIDIEESTPKYGYLVCDVDKNLREELKKWQSYKLTPQGNLYKYWDELNLYVEIIDFRGILRGAKERHKAFFRMLGIDKEIDWT